MKAGCKHKLECPVFDKWLEILAVEGLTTKERRDLNFSESSEKEDECVCRAAVIKPGSE